MGKILLFIFAAIAGWLLYKGLLGKAAGKSGAKAGTGSSSNRVEEKMLKCDRCGVFIPASESMSLDGALTCRSPDRCPQRQSV
ncbi:MAG: hypothetical protein JNN20_15975 [Betaproteobacteria bacterium]|nr:hypothetical protein [Betaproteobacteria bacterium]